MDVGPFEQFGLHNQVDNQCHPEFWDQYLGSKYHTQHSLRGRTNSCLYHIAFPVHIGAPKTVC